MLRVSGQSAHSWPDVRCRGARRLPWTPWPVLPGVARTLAAAWSRRAGAWRGTGSPRQAEQVGEWWRREARRHPSSQGRARSSRALQLCYQRRADKFLSRLIQKGRLAFFSCARGSCWMLRVVTFFPPPPVLCPGGRKRVAGYLCTAVCTRWRGEGQGAGNSPEPCLELKRGTAVASAVESSLRSWFLS